MKAIGTAIVLLFGITSCCLGVGDPVSSTTKEENRETTTFQRDGKTILRIIRFQPPEPERRMLRQIVVFNDKDVLEICDFNGKRLFRFLSVPNVSVGVQQNSSTGFLESVGLMDDSINILEEFEVKDSRLTPISGKRLEHTRAFTKDMTGLFKGVVDKKTTPEAFMKSVNDMVKKHNAKEPDNRKDKDRSK